MKTIVGIGEVLWDIYEDGRKVAGGAPFNFAFHCHQLGHEAAIVSRVGDDDLGRELRARVRELGLSDEHIQTDHQFPTGTVQVVVKDAQPTYTIDTRAAWGNLEWTESLDTLIGNAGALCHGTLAMNGGKASREVIEKMSLRVGLRGGCTIYDMNLRKGFADLPDERAVFWSRWLKVTDDVKNNELEALKSQVCKSMGISNLVDEQKMLQLLIAGTGRDDAVLIVTRGENGADAYALSGRNNEGAQPAKLVDTVGAGDAFTAAMICLHLEGRPMHECLRFANCYAARVCEHRGATPHIDRKDVEAVAFGKLE